jgi:flagellar biosynthesis/type III secretory pathway protein FliH
LEQHLQAAYQQGRQEGLDAARQEMAGLLDAMAARLARTIEELTGLRQRFSSSACSG